MAKYLVTVKFALDDGYQSIYQYYITDETENEIIQKLNYKDEGSCCGQTRCLACLTGGYTITYCSSLKIDETNKNVLEIVCSKQIKSLNTLIDICLDEQDSDTSVDGF